MLTRLSPLVLNALSLLLLAATAVSAAPAPDARSILILDSTITGGQNSPEAVQARLLGFTVEVATATQWYTKSTTDFRSYRAIVFGDPSCSVSTEPLAAAEDTLDVWGPTVTGNVTDCRDRPDLSS